MRGQRARGTTSIGLGNAGVKLLLDACVWGGAVGPLREAGLDVEWVGDWKKDPGDDEILNVAFVESRILVTLDRDFGEIIVLRGVPHFGLIRLVGISARLHAAAILHVLQTYPSECSSAIFTVEPGRIRIRSEVERAGKDS